MGSKKRAQQQQGGEGKGGEPCFRDLSNEEDPAKGRGTLNIRAKLRKKEKKEKKVT